VKKRGLVDRLKLAGKALRGGSFTLLDEAAVEAFGGTHRLLWDWVRGGGDINEEIRGDFRRVRARARDLAKANAYIKQFLNMVSVNAIGHTGFALNAQVESSRGIELKTINRKIEAGWEEWSHEPVTMDGKFDLISAQMHLAKYVFRDGEAFVRIWRGIPDNPFGIALEIIDPELVDDQYNRAAGTGGETTEINMGVEVDPFGKPIAYHVWNVNPSAMTMSIGDKRRRDRIPAEDMIHLFLPDRINQRRGYTCFYPAMIPARMLRGYTEAELVAARASSAKVGFMETTGDSPPPADVGGKDNASPITMDANPGSIEMLPPGTKFTSWDPQHPTSAFPAFVKATLREIASGLGVSYNSLGNDLEGVNFSSMRSGLLIERDLWRVFHSWWMFAFLRVIYKEWLRTSLLTGELSLGSRDWRQYRKVKWAARGWRWVDPLKDVQAGILAVAGGLASRTQLLDEQGLDYDLIVRQLKHEQDVAAENGVSVTAPLKLPTAGGGGSGDGGSGGSEGGSNSIDELISLNRAAVLNGGRHEDN